MNLSLFKTFVKVVENRNLSRTAEELNLSQPAVSKQIQALEEIYGVLLLERSGRKLKTTPAGEALYNCAQEILRVLEKTDQIMEELSESRRGRLLLGASTIPGQYILPQYLKGFKDRYPNVNILMKIADTESIFKQVAERELDLGVVGAWMPNSKVEGFKWKEDELIVLVSPHHHLAGRSEVNLKELVAEKWVFREKGSGTRMATEDILAGLGIRTEDLDIQAEVGSTEAVASAVEAQMGLALVSRHAAAQWTRNDKLVALKIAGGIAKRDIYVIYPRQKNRRRTVDNFLDFLKTDPAL
ncbi:MAG: LysR family transcriptional regulator [Syntrophomonadaceae bacterium]|nr:LysR family transcriptional regulator [Syntrophomonadaceae bacterium]